MRGDPTEIVAVAAAAVDEFFAASTDGVCVRRVSVESMDPFERDLGKPHLCGAFVPEERVAYVQDVLDPNCDTRETTIHELCHAAVLTLPLNLDRTLWTFEDPKQPHAHGGKPGEAFAETCAIGPLAVQLVGASCDTDTAGAEAYDFLASELYVHPTPELHASTLTFEPRGAISYGGELWDLDIHILVDGVLRIEASYGDVDDDLAFVDPETGEERVPNGGFVAPEEVPPPRGFRRIEAASAGGATLLLGEITAPNGGTARRLIEVLPDGYARVGCARPFEVVFAHQDALWSAWADGDTVRWGKWVP